MCGWRMCICVANVWFDKCIYQNTNQVSQQQKKNNIKSRCVFSVRTEEVHFISYPERLLIWRTGRQIFSSE